MAYLFDASYLCTFHLDRFTGLAVKSWTGRRFRIRLVHLVRAPATWHFVTWHDEGFQRFVGLGLAQTGDLQWVYSIHIPTLIQVCTNFSCVSCVSSPSEGARERVRNGRPAPRLNWRQLIDFKNQITSHINKIKTKLHTHGSAKLIDIISSNHQLKLHCLLRY